MRAAQTIFVARPPFVKYRYDFFIDHVILCSLRTIWGLVEYLFNECAGAGGCGRNRPGGDLKDTYSGSIQYSDGSIAINPNTGSPYSSPSGLDIDSNIKYGEGGPGKLSLFSQFKPGGPMDYQRPGSGGVLPVYVDTGNYNYGAVMAGAGYSYSDTLRYANYARGLTMHVPPDATAYGIGQRALNNISQGWVDYDRGRFRR